MTVPGKAKRIEDIRMIKQTVFKYPWVGTSFPDKPGIASAQEEISLSSGKQYKEPKECLKDMFRVELNSSSDKELD